MKSGEDLVQRGSSHRRLDGIHNGVKGTKKDLAFAAYNTRYLVLEPSEGQIAQILHPSYDTYKVFSRTLSSLLPLARFRDSTNCSVYVHRFCLQLLSHSTLA